MVRDFEAYCEIVNLWNFGQEFHTGTIPQFHYCTISQLARLTNSSTTKRNSYTTSIFPGDDFGEEGVLLVFGREYERYANIWPLDSQRGIVEAHSTVGCGAIEIVALVTEQRIVLKDDEAMGEPARNVKLLSVLARQRHSDVLSKGWRTFSDVDNHIPHRPLDHANELPLGMRRGLPVESTHNALRREAFVVLHKHIVYSRVAVALVIVRLAEPSPRAAKDVRLDDLDAFNLCGSDFHGTWFVVRGSWFVVSGFGVFEFRVSAGRCFAFNSQEPLSSVLCPLS